MLHSEGRKIGRLCWERDAACCRKDPPYIRASFSDFSRALITSVICQTHACGAQTRQITEVLAQSKSAKASHWYRVGSFLLCSCFSQSDFFSASSFILLSPAACPSKTSCQNHKQNYSQNYKQTYNQTYNQTYSQTYSQNAAQLYMFSCAAFRLVF